MEVWAEDEARLGLKPVTRPTWWPKGQRPRSCGRTRYEWLDAYGFVRPRTGESFTLLHPRVRVERMSMIGREYRLTRDMEQAAKAFGLDLAPQSITLRQAYADAPGQATFVWRMGY